MLSPLAGKTVLLTRPRRQAEESRPLLEAEGAMVLIQPVQEIVPVEPPVLAEVASEPLVKVNRVIFSSSNGVFFFLRALDLADRDGRGRRALLHSLPLAAVGPGTAQELQHAGLSPDVVPENHSAEGLLEALADEARRGFRFLSVRGDRGRTILEEGLAQLGGEVRRVEVYHARDIKKPDEEIARRMSCGEIDFTFITSSATGAGTVRLFGTSLCRTRLVSISPLTTAAMEDLGYQVAIEATEATIPGMIEGVKRS
ncbi:MAG: uroporphyrinogen-III synthase [Thermoguttaceae bacterium]|jgi:uroporphyrinogen III methyltransferase/synthase